MSEPSEPLDWKLRFGRQWQCEAGGHEHEHNTKEERRKCREHHERRVQDHQMEISELKDDLTATRDEKNKHIQIMEKLSDNLTAARDDRKEHLQMMTVVSKQLTAAKDENEQLKINLKKEENRNVELNIQLKKTETELVYAKKNAEADVRKIKTDREKKHEKKKKKPKYDH